MMTDLQIYAELGSLLEGQLTQSLAWQGSLQDLRAMLEKSQLQLGTLKSQLQTLQDDSMTLKSSLLDLSLRMDRISTELQEHRNSLMSLGEDISSESRRARTREKVLIGVCGVSLGGVLVLLLSGLIRN